MRRSLVFYLVLVFLVAVGGTYTALQVFGPRQQAAPPEVIEVRVVVTATQGPTQTPFIITATPPPGQVVLPTGLPLDTTGNFGATTGPAPTIDPTIIGASEALGLTATSLPANCILHTVVEGDTPFGIALQYGANGFDLLTVNGLTEETATQIQIGEVLIVPLAGCPIVPPPTPETSVAQALTITAAATEAEATAEATAEISPTPTPSPTITLAPTATNAQVEIVGVLSAGDITAEAVRIRNTGNTVDITGWTLTDLDGNEYTFGQQRLFSNAELTIFTRAGQNTPVVLFWGLDAAIFGEAGDVITLRDANGRVQATLRLPVPQDLN